MTLAAESYSLVLGLGLSGMAMARFLHSKGVTVKATDSDPAREKEAAQLRAMGVDTLVGSHDPAVFDNAGAIVASPGIPLTMPLLASARKKGVRIMGELDIFSQYNTTPVVAITGTNGKTTVTTLVRDMLEASGITTFMGGNIGTPLVEYLMAPGNADVVVAEVSSFQLDLADRFAPDVAVLLNIAEDHLDRYDGMAGYARSKWSIFKNQSGTDVAVLNRAVRDLALPCSAIAAKCYEFSSDPTTRVKPGARIREQDIRFDLGDTTETLTCKSLPGLPGLHNRENIGAAALAALAAGANFDGIRNALAAFKGLPHRITFVRELDRVRYYDDSKATNVDAVVRALECFDGGVILILGGREKGTDFIGLEKAVNKRVTRVIAMGEAASSIAAVFTSKTALETAPDMDTAVGMARAAAQPGDTVLLSPACASFDLYENYGQRGDHFTALVNALEERHG